MSFSDLHLDPIVMSFSDLHLDPTVMSFSDLHLDPIVMSFSDLHLDSIAMSLSDLKLDSISMAPPRLSLDVLLMAYEMTDDDDERRFDELNSFLRVNRDLHLQLNLVLGREVARCPETSAKLRTIICWLEQDFTASICTQVAGEQTRYPTVVCVNLC
jgi:hypothetical protein